MTRLITFTDVEDKAITEAENEKVSLEELTQRNADIFFADAELLRIEPATYNPRSSTTVDQAVKIIKILLEKGYAYWYKHQGVSNVYFEPLKFQGFGKLSKIDTSKWPKKKRRFHKDNYPVHPGTRAISYYGVAIKKETKSTGTRRSAEVHPLGTFKTPPW